MRGVTSPLTQPNTTRMCLPLYYFRWSSVQFRYGVFCWSSGRQPWDGEATWKLVVLEGWSATSWAATGRMDVCGIGRSRCEATGQQLGVDCRLRVEEATIVGNHM